MNALDLKLQGYRDRLGIKGPRAAEWLAANGIPLPMTPNTWAHSDKPSSADALLVARLGTAEFFLEDGAAGTTLKRVSQFLNEHPPGVYPVMREDWGFVLGGERVHDVLAQVCNVNFAALSLATHPVIMTLMIGVAVLVVPQRAASARDGADERRDPAGRQSAGRQSAGRQSAGRQSAGRQYRIWCDPTFGPYICESLGAVVIECGGRYTGVSG